MSVTRKKRPLNGTDNETYYNWDIQLDESTELLYVSYKRLKKNGKKIREKIKKEEKQKGSSKTIEKWRDGYNDAVKDFSENVEKVYEIYKSLPKSSDEAEAGFPRSNKHSQSLGPTQRTRNRGRADPSDVDLKIEPLPDKPTQWHHEISKQKLHEAKKRYEQSQTYIQTLTGELESARQGEEVLKNKLRDLEDRFERKERDLQRKIEELTADLSTVSKREDGLRKQLAIEKNRTIETKPEEMGFGRDDRRTKSLEPHQRSRSKRNTDPRYLEGQTDQLQDEQSPHLLQNLGDKVKNLEQQNDEMLQKIQSMTGEVEAAKQTEGYLRTQLRDAQDSYQQKIQGLTFEATLARQREEGLQKQLHDVQNSYQQKIQGLTSEATAARQREEGLQKQLHDVQNRTIKTEPEEAGFRRDDRRTKSLESHQRSKRNKNPGNLEGQQDEMQVDQRHQLQNLEQQNGQMLQKIQLMTGEVEERKQTEGQLRKQLHGVQNRVNQLSAQLEREKDDKDDALRRLSALVSSRIRDGNINIVDLSDQNRPTKLGEVLSELYDNDWTDCFDELEGDDSKEAENIHKLLKILQDIYDTCMRWSTDKFFENVQCAMDKTYLDQDASNVMVELPEDMKQPIKEFKKSRGLKVLPSIYKLVRRKLPQYFTGQFNSDVFLKYIKKCTEFSWLAAIQDPPLFLNAERGDKFNTSVFREYMKRGPYVEYVVWPALHIKEGGPLLMKGVAQGAKEKPVQNTAM